MQEIKSCGIKQFEIAISGLKTIILTMTKMVPKYRSLKEKVEVWLEDPLKPGLEEALDRSETLLYKLKEKLKNDTEKGHILGPLIGQVKSMQNKLKTLEPINWVSYKGGRLAIGHRPGIKLITDIQLQGGTHILTLLSESEGAAFIQKEAGKVGLHWLWLSMSSATPPAEDRLPEAKALFTNMTNALENAASIYIHCSAGIHRTGMISYAFLRFCELTSDEAKEMLKILRPTTRQDVGEERLEWGDQFGKE